MGQFGSEAPVGAAFIFSRLLSLKKHLVFFTLVETNFKITKIVIKKFHNILPILSMEKDVFSIVVNGTFLYSCPFSTKPMALIHFYILNMASYMILSFF